MIVEPTIFRAYDIRGVYGSQLSDDLAEHLGRAFGTWLQREYSGNRVVIGRDNRPSSPQLKKRLISGLVGVGCDVTDLDYALTPLIHYAVLKKGFTGGVMITASHNPSEYNGFRLGGPSVKPIFGDELQAIKDLIVAEDYESPAAGAGKVSSADYSSEYLAEIVRRCLLARPLKVVVGCGNATPSLFAPELFKKLGARVIPLHCRLDSDFPHGVPDPEDPVFLAALSFKVREVKADLGVAFDADGDRFGLVDEAGNIHGNDKLFALLVTDILEKNPGAKVALDIKCSYVPARIVRERGGTPIILRTGHPYFRELMQKDPQVLFGGELSGHTFIKDDYYGFDDGLYVMARLAKIFSLSNLPISQQLDQLPKTYHTPELKVTVADQDKFALVKKLEEQLKSWGRVETIDGVKVWTDPQTWVLIRASNTSPYLSIRLEADEKEKLVKLAARLVEVMEEIPNLDLTPIGPRAIETATRYV